MPNILKRRLDKFNPSCVAHRPDIKPSEEPHKRSNGPNMVLKTEPLQHVQSRAPSYPSFVCRPKSSRASVPGRLTNPFSSQASDTRSDFSRRSTLQSIAESEEETDAPAGILLSSLNLEPNFKRDISETVAAEMNVDQ